MFITTVIATFQRTVSFVALAGAFAAASFSTSHGNMISSAGAATTGCAPVPRLSVTTFPSYGTALPLIGGTGASSPELRSTDPVGPFPLSAIVPFPWATIEGIWTMTLPDGTRRYFSFEVRSACDGRRFVQVLGFDQQTYRVNAEGIGLGQTNDTMVRAVMTSATSQYMVFIRQFKMPAGKLSKLSTVVTVRPFNGDETDDIHMIARKASPLTLEKYIEKQRENEARREAEARRRR